MFYYNQYDLDDILTTMKCCYGNYADNVRYNISIGEDCKDFKRNMLILNSIIEIVEDYTPITASTTDNPNCISESQLHNLLAIFTKITKCCFDDPGKTYSSPESETETTCHIEQEATHDDILLESGGYIILENNSCVK